MAFAHIREDVADVPWAFVPGATVLRPVRIALREKGVDTRYLILLTSNIRPTIDPDKPEPIPTGWVKRVGLKCTGAVHPKVKALRSALDGPAFWTDPTVNYTIFVNDDLAMAQKAAPLARDLVLKKIRVSEA